ncbi:MAG TPA: TOMM precursor leader peptide-binding protein, partial [Gemmataceae bacterium]|nr:TOMM precursor leader peptide-binding protein [Gemmataceae bacterium]
MLRRPRFKPHLRVEVVPGEGVFLLSEQEQRVLQGRLFELVASRLDGSPAEEICARLRGQTSAAEVHYTLARLEQKGVLLDGDAPTPPGEAALWTIQGVDPAEAARRLTETPAAVRVVGEVDDGPFQELLLSLRVRLDGEPRLTVVLTDGYLRRGLEAINAEALKSGRPWLLAKPIGAQVWLGPLFVPGTTACWRCLADRMRSNSPVAGYLDERAGHSGLSAVDRCASPATLQIAHGLTANAVAAWIGRGGLPALEGKIRTLDILSGRSETHELIRQPSCPACGSRPRMEPSQAPLVLQSSRKNFTQDGGCRTVTPEQTIERYSRHVSPITGAVPMLERDGLGEADGGGVVHVYVSGHNAARGPSSLRGLRSDLRSLNAGKGATDIQAKASALCEGLERYSGVFRGDEPRRKARLADLGDAGIHLHSCLLFSDKQYRDRDQWEARGSGRDPTPAPFDPEAELEWTPVWSLTQGRTRWLPTAFCYFDYPQNHDRAFCWSNSNGNAAGNTREEAILQGYLELVERDGIALWWYNRVRLPAVDLDSFHEPYLDELREFLRKRSRELWVLDATTDLGIPVFAAATRDVGGGPEQILFGFGAHLDARLALLRAVTEMNQMLGRALLHPQDDDAAGASINDRGTLEWLRKATIANQPYLQPRSGSARTASSYAPSRTDDIKDDVVACQKLVEERGMEMLVLDQTRPEIGLPVVKVIVPGMRHFWPRFAPGRL